MTRPKTLQEALVYFSDQDRAFNYAVSMRWPDSKVTCPRCGSDRHYFIQTRRLWLCRPCNKQFTVKVGTIFEDSPLGLDKWMAAFWMLCNCKNGISSMEIHRALGVTQKTAWFMLQRLRLAMQDEFLGTKLGGSGSEVEADETFIGGKARNMHKSKKIGRGFEKRGGFGKTVVMGMLERGGKVRTKVIQNRDRETLHAQIRETIHAGTSLYTDEHHPYKGLGNDYEHQVIDHAEKYVDGRVHTNGLENFWSLLKRGLSGTYVSVEPFHLFRYLDEQVFRYNHRKNMSDADRFELAMSNVFGKRLTYEQLTGKNESPRHQATRTGETEVPF